MLHSGTCFPFLQLLCFTEVNEGTGWTRVSKKPDKQACSHNSQRIEQWNLLPSCSLRKSEFISTLLKMPQLPIYSTNHLILCFSSKLWCMPGSRKALDHVASLCRCGNKVKWKYMLQQVLFCNVILWSELFLQRVNTNSNKYWISLCGTYSFFARHLNKYFDVSWTTEILKALPSYWIRSYLPKTWKQVISSNVFGNIFCMQSVLL